MSGATVAVLGAGSWGTALADCLARNGHDTTVWAWEPEVAGEVTEEHRNEAYLPGVDLEGSLRATSDMGAALAGAEIVVSVSPSHVVRDVMGRAARFLAPGSLLVSASKGLELSTGQRMSEVLEEAVGPEAAAGCVVLSGPSFAAELARRLPTAVTLASRSEENAVRVQALFQNEHFRLYTQGDVIGTELGGSLKNVIAIAAGIVDGLGFGHNTVAALITRGLAEIGRLAEALGGRPETLSGLAGLGDLVLTCTGALSRNRRVGQGLGRGLSLADAGAGLVAEGVRTTLVACDLARREGIEMPIAAQMKAVLYEDTSPRDALEALMLRSLKRE